MENTNDQHTYPLTWSFPEYPRHERGTGWFVTACLIGGALFTFALITGNFLFAAIIVFIAFIIALQHYRKPMTVNFSITEDGITIGEKQIPWKEIKTFWILYEPPMVKNLYFHFKGLRPTLRIPIDDQNPLAIRAALTPYLEEDLEKENEPFSDAVGRIFKL